MDNVQIASPAGQKNVIIPHTTIEATRLTVWGPTWEIAGKVYVSTSVIGGGSFRPPADPRSVPSARPRVEFPRGAPRSRIMAEARLAETDIEIEADTREGALPGIGGGGGGEGEGQG